MKPKPVVILALATLLLVVLIQNTHVVTLHLFFWKLGISQIILIPLAMVVGFVSGFIVAESRGARKKVQSEN